MVTDHKLRLLGWNASFFKMMKKKAEGFIVDCREKHWCLEL